MPSRAFAVLSAVALSAHAAHAENADLGGATCTDNKQAHLEQKCSCNPDSELNAFARYVPKDKTVGGEGYIPLALPERCDLPVFIQCQLDVDEPTYTANYPFTEYGRFYQFTHASGHFFASHMMMGVSVSAWQKDGSPVNITDRNSVPRNVYVMEYTYNSETAFKWWKWYLYNFFANLDQTGPDAQTMNTVGPSLANTHSRIVFSGMCQTYADQLYALAGVQAYQAYGNIQ